MKVVINTCFGGFGLSLKAAEWLREQGHPCAIAEFEARAKWSRREDMRGTLKLTENHRLNNGDLSIPRDDPALVAVVEELGKDADGGHANLKVVEIPDGVDWEIGDYDGREWVVERHRTWR